MKEVKYEDLAGQWWQRWYFKILALASALAWPRPSRACKTGVGQHGGREKAAETGAVPGESKKPRAARSCGEVHILLALPNFRAERVSGRGSLNSGIVIADAKWMWK